MLFHCPGANGISVYAPAELDDELLDEELDELDELDELEEELEELDELDELEDEELEELLEDCWPAPGLGTNSMISPSAVAASTAHPIILVPVAAALPEAAE